MEPGQAWRTRLWTDAKAALRQQLPVETVRRRIARAAELGLDYATYATILDTAGRDPAALILTSNALQLHATHRLPDHIRDKLARLRRIRLIALLNAPLDPIALAPDLPAFDHIFRAPPPHATWAFQREAMQRLPHGLPAAALLLVTAAPFETSWATAGRMGAQLDAARWLAA